ncbi:MAG TPA: hypothetical protein VGV87_19955 [Blastocatellia bacterium]|jgi:hypothetical protein|nr:hypothetical protein [Blastocatellia bacterium]
MSITVCLSANTIGYPTGGGHFWVYLNWALGLRALGCRVIWLEAVKANWHQQKVKSNILHLRSRLERYGLAGCLAIYSGSEGTLPPEVQEQCLTLDVATEADLLLNMRYGMRQEVVDRFRRSVLLDIDPGLLQFWMSAGQVGIARYDLYFTIGETVGEQNARVSGAGIKWQYTPPCVALNWWPPRRAAADAPLTTVAHWYGGIMEFDGKSFANAKRDAFAPYLELPSRTEFPLELALDMSSDDEDQVKLWANGWRVRDSASVASTSWDYQRYIQDSRGEFSCAKPSCIHFQNAWISDRTLCYLASGKPAVVEHTGPSRFLPDAEGLLRFRSFEEAVRCLKTVANDYERQCKRARSLAEEYFDARKVAGKLLERSLP